MKQRSLLAGPGDQNEDAERRVARADALAGFAWPLLQRFRPAARWPREGGAVASPLDWPWRRAVVGPVGRRGTRAVVHARGHEGEEPHVRVALTATVCRRSGPRVCLLRRGQLVRLEPRCRSGSDRVHHLRGGHRPAGLGGVLGRLGVWVQALVHLCHNAGNRAAGASALVALLLGDRPLGEGVGLEAVVGDRVPALDRDAVGTGCEAGFGPLKCGQFLAMLL